MKMMMIVHETENGEHWAKAWQKDEGSRHEMFGEIGVKCRIFRDPNNPDFTGVLAEIPDMTESAVCEPAAAETPMYV